LGDKKVIRTKRFGRNRMIIGKWLIPAELEKSKLPIGNWRTAKGRLYRGLWFR
jgi:hypothetical protein